jgi:hypothetical protein
MKHTIDSGELAVKSVQLAQRIPDAAKRNACIAAAFAFGSKYLDDEGLSRIKEALKMSDLATMFFNDGVEKSAVIIAKKLLRRGISADAVVEDTGLDESTVRKLQTELDEAV